MVGIWRRDTIYSWIKFSDAPESIMAAIVEENQERKTERYKRLPEGLDSEVLMCAVRTGWLKPPTSWGLEDCRFPTEWR